MNCATAMSRSASAPPSRGSSAPQAEAAVTRLSDGRNVSSEMLLFAAGRVGATDRLNLEAAGIAVDHRGRIKVDPMTLQTSVPHIYAAGDVMGFPSLAAPAMVQGRVAACHALGMEPMAPPEFFPYGIYSVPEISTTGLTEEEVRTRGIPYEVGVARFRETSRGHIMGLNSGMMKMIFSTKTRRLLGVHILGEGATELIHIGQAVLNLKGTIDYFIQNTFNYPTLAEAYKIAGLDAWNRMTRQIHFPSFRDGALAPDHRCAIAHRSCLLRSAPEWRSPIVLSNPAMNANPRGRDQSAL